ncbi:MAG TPA: DUF1080 domain-containing protein [Chitinophagaceae bacterium]|nr:DUF1080 domain-containing protein [Chitinophagaceae bacterium]
MKALSFFTMMVLLAFSASSQTASQLEGRWDLTVDQGFRIAPSWLEVRHSGIQTLNGYFVADGGSSRPVSKVNFDGKNFNFSIPPQWERADKDLVVEGVLEGDKMTGTMINPEGKKWTFTGVRAPTLVRSSAPVWGQPIVLFNGKSTEGWHASGEKKQWVAENGILKSPTPGSNLITDKTFTDFKLHIEFRYPENGNSGVYLRGRYEIQIEDSKNKWIWPNEIGGVYGFIAPSQRFAKGPGVWQTYDITLVGRHVTVVANGITIICNQEIPGITGGALDSKEGEPGPIMLQGDHEPIEYRNIKITPAK